MDVTANTESIPNMAITASMADMRRQRHELAS